MPRCPLKDARISGVTRSPSIHPASAPASKSSSQEQFRDFRLPVSRRIDQRDVAVIVEDIGVNTVGQQRFHARNVAVQRDGEQRYGIRRRAGGRLGPKLRPKYRKKAKRPAPSRGHFRTASSGNSFKPASQVPTTSVSPDSAR